MERKQICVMFFGVALCAAAFVGASVANAATCVKCRDLMFVDSEGKCSDCGGSTTSGALKLCAKCSARRHQCEHCLAALTAADEAATETPAVDVPSEHQPPASPAINRRSEQKPLLWSVPAATTPTENTIRPTVPHRSDDVSAKPQTAPLPVLGTSPLAVPSESAVQPRIGKLDPAKAGAYTAGKWRYQMQIEGPGTSREGRWGWLTYDNQKLPRGEVNDYYETPWGPIYWSGVPSTTWGVHGWMPAPLPQSHRQGMRLEISAATLATGSTNPQTLTAQPSAAPRPQTLELNKTHNGQLAKLHLGNIVVIRLPGNPASGYRWQELPTAPSLMVVRPTVRPQYVAPTPSSGESHPTGTFIFAYQAVQPGNGTIRLQYVHPGDPTRPRDAFSVNVIVSGPTHSASASRPAAATPHG